jgi:hypothetical protein
MYSSIDVKNNTWEKPAILDTRLGPGGYSMIACGGSLYCCIWIDAEFSIRINRIENGIAQDVGVNESGVQAGLVESRGKLVLVWLNEDGIRYKTYETGNWGPTSHIDETITTAACAYPEATLDRRDFLSCRLYVASDATGTIHLLYSKPLPTRNLFSSETGVFYRTLTPVERN